MNSTSNDLIVVALGSNLAGNFPSVEALLDAAVARMAAAGLRVVGRSSWWRSASWPDARLPDYRNGVVVVETRLDPHAVLLVLREIESEFGRHRSVANAPRTLDLDLIAHGRTVMDDAELTLPHPRAAERLFVMGPLAEVVPDWVHPVMGQTAVELAAAASVGTDARPG
jgi:2-amino-4-hydroxy-6-hydroxymethyldihydropteridine diphosphokinase